MLETLDIKRKKIVSTLEDYMADLEEQEKQEIILHKEQIITSLMSGEFRDLGGLTAMRGFVYQYYVSMYYIVSMIYQKQDNWWNSVVLEYFDDITLIGENKIRFVQVKTVKEGGTKSHAANDFVKRKPLKDPDNPKIHFNSWVEKNVLNYDYFLESNLIKEVDKSTYNPQFEIVTNTKQSSLSNLINYTGNIYFEIKDAINSEDRLKAAILKPIENLGFEFGDTSLKEIDYYLKRLYINKFGSTRELYENIIDMIEETISITDIRAKSIAEYVFQKMFAFVISNSHEDNEDRIKKDELIITKLQIEYLIAGWVTEAKELISERSYYDSAWAIFNRAIVDLESEFKEQFANEKLKVELLKELQWINEHITESNRGNSTYCVLVLNKIFNGNNNLSMWDFEHGDIKSNLKESLRFIIYFLVFYEEHSEVYNTAKLLFHEGHSSVIENILFTLYHARNISNKVTSMEKIKFSLNECYISRHITLDLYCLLIGTKKDVINPTASSISSMFKVTSANSNMHKITDVPDNMRFVDVGEVEDLFESFKEGGIDLDSFKHNELLPRWKEYLDGIVNNLKENYIEG
ncbi:dsDNA nuclease domain-containing protein [Priestia sp. GS2]|uniref:dsDNA nuclease domain-containing protein n=1 Tax=Priestia sp. GS2 TaxID=3117403 RepID=UPI002EDB8280